MLRDVLGVAGRVREFTRGGAAPGCDTVILGEGFPRRFSIDHDTESLEKSIG